MKLYNYKISCIIYIFTVYGKQSSHNEPRKHGID